MNESKSFMELSLKAVIMNGSDHIDIRDTIQGHGALFVFTREGVLISSAGSIEGISPNLGHALSAQNLDRCMYVAISHSLNNPENSAQAFSFEIGGRMRDVTMYQSQDLLFVEVENRWKNTLPPDRHTFLAQAVVHRLHQAKSIGEVLQIAVDELRNLVGFDHVIAYRFDHDDLPKNLAESRSGKITAPAVDHFPCYEMAASEQQRHVFSPVCLVADTESQGSPLMPNRRPGSMQKISIDCSVLCSPEPAYLAYLHAKKIRAAMTISIVIQGQLWGIFCCHHGAPRLAPYPARLSCAMLATLVGAAIERIDAETTAQAIEDIAMSWQRALELADNPNGLYLAFNESHAGVIQLMGANGFAMSVDGRLLTSGDVPGCEQISRLIGRLALCQDDDYFHSADLTADVLLPAGWPPPIRSVLAIHFNREKNACLLWFRNGKDIPIDSAAASPASGRGTPWRADQLEIARRLRLVLQRVVVAKPTEVNPARERLWATLGHDLRIPLQAIMACASSLAIGAADPKTATTIQRIIATSHRMARLIAEVIDVSKLQSGMELRMAPQSLDCNSLIKEIMAETLLAFPLATITFNSEGDGIITADGDRISQVVGNLLANAVNHGIRGMPITITSCKSANNLEIIVSNFSPSLSDELLFDIFSPFKSGNATSSDNKQSLGLGLYIVREIVEAHRGNVSVHQASGVVSFMVTLPVC